MAVQRRARFGVMAVSLISITLTFLTAAGMASLESFFIFGLIEIGLLRELVDPVELRPRWQKNIDNLIIVGIIIFALIIIRRIISFLPSGAF